MAVKTTIRDTLIAPYEIDVDEHNFTLVEVTISKGGKVAGKDTKAGERQRKFVGYFNTLGGCINRVIQERIALDMPELEGKIVDLKTFLKAQESYKKVMVKWMNYLGTPFTVTKEDGMMIISPSKVLKNAGV